MSNPTQEYNDYIRANLPPGITYDEVRARYVTENGKYFPTYLEAKWYLDYIKKFGFIPIPESLFANGEQGAWYDPSDLTTLYQDAAGTTPVTADGDPVGYMADKSGNGNHATQSTAAARPVYRTDGTLHWLEFDGVDDKMSTGRFIEVGGGFYAAHGFNVLSEGGDTVENDTFGCLHGGDRESIGWRSSGTYNYGAQLRVNAGTVYNTKFFVSGGQNSFGNDYVGEGWHDGITINVRLSNGQTASASAPTSTTNSSFPLSLVNDSSYRFYGGLYRDGNPPSSNERDTVQKYLASKSGVTL